MSLSCDFLITHVEHELSAATYFTPNRWMPENSWNRFRENNVYAGFKYSLFKPHCLERKEERNSGSHATTCSCSVVASIPAAVFQSFVMARLPLTGTKVQPAGICSETRVTCVICHASEPGSFPSFRPSIQAYATFRLVWPAANNFCFRVWPPAGPRLGLYASRR